MIFDTIIFAHNHNGTITWYKVQNYKTKQRLLEGFFQLEHLLH